MSQVPAEDHCIVADAAAWRAWLDANEDTHPGVWLVLAKKGTTEPTTLSYDQALDEALCGGWIDGQKQSRDQATFLQRFTPRRPKSVWSVRNTGLVQNLIDDGRMRERGHAEIERAKADGRWDRAYAGAANATMPEDLLAAIAAVPEAQASYEALNATSRFALYFRVTTAHSAATREKRIAALVQRLAAGEAL